MNIYISLEKSYNIHRWNNLFKLKMNGDNIHKMIDEVSIYYFSIYLANCSLYPNWFVFYIQSLFHIYRRDENCFYIYSKEFKCKPIYI